MPAFIPTVSIPALSQETGDGYRTDTLYSHKLWTVVPAVTPSRDTSIAAVDRYTNRIDRKTAAAGLQHSIGEIRSDFQVDTLTAVALLATSVSAAIQAGVVPPSRADRVARRLELAARAHGVRFVW